MIYKRKVTIHFSQVDAAGILFFGRFFGLASDVFEGWLKELGYEWDFWFKNPDWVAPLRHVEADYLRPLWGGQEYDVECTISEVGESSLKLRFEFKQGNQVHAEVRLVHVFASLQRGTKIPIPEAIRARMLSLRLGPVAVQSD